MSQIDDPSYSKNWGDGSKTKTYASIMCIAIASSRLVAYNNGYLYEFDILSIL